MHIVAGGNVIDVYCTRKSITLVNNLIWLSVNLLCSHTQKLAKIFKQRGVTTPLYCSKYYNRINYNKITATSKVLIYTKKTLGG